MGRQAGKKQIPASGLVLGLAGTQREGLQIAPTEVCKPLTAVPGTPLHTHPGPFVALRKLYFTRRLNKFLLVMHLQSHHQSNEFGKHWVNKARNFSAAGLDRAFTMLGGTVTLQDGPRPVRFPKLMRSISPGSRPAEHPMGSADPRTTPLLHKQRTASTEREGVPHGHTAG